MSRKHSIWLVLVLMTLPAVPGQAEETADDVIAHYVETIGGEEALKAVETMRMSGTMSMSGMQAPMTIEQKRPNKFRMEMEIQGMKIIQAFDGEKAWGVMPMMGTTEPELLSEDLQNQLEGQAEFDGPLVDYKEKGHQVELVGKEEVEGTEAYKLKVTRKNGDVVDVYLDTEYYLPFQMRAKVNMQGNEVNVTTKLGDYQEIGGILVPHSYEQVFEGVPAGANMTFDKVEVNVGVDDARFTLPAKEEAKEEGKEEGKEEEKEEG